MSQSVMRTMVPVCEVLALGKRNDKKTLMAANPKETSKLSLDAFFEVMVSSPCMDVKTCLTRLTARLAGAVYQRGTAFSSLDTGLSTPVWGFCRS